MVGSSGVMQAALRNVAFIRKRGEAEVSGAVTSDLPWERVQLTCSVWINGKAGAGNGDGREVRVEHGVG